MKKWFVVIIVLLVALFGSGALLYSKYLSEDIPDDFNQKIIEAHRSIVKFEYEKANVFYKAALKQQPSLALLQEYLAFLVSQDDLKASYDIAQKILKIDPNHFLSNLIRTAFLVKRNHLAIAIENIKLAAQNQDSLNNSIYAILASLNCFITHETTQFNQISSQIKSQMPAFYARQSLLYGLLSKNYNNALSIAKNTVEQYPSVDNALIYSKLISLYDMPKAKTVFREYLSDSFLTDSAIEVYLQHYSLNTDINYIFSDSLYRLGENLSDVSKAPYFTPDRALISHVALMLNSNNTLAKLQLASYYTKVGDIEQAIEYFEKIDNRSFYYRLIFRQLSNLLFDLGKTQDAIKVLTRTHNSDMTNPEPLLELAHIYYKNNDFHRAIRYYSSALDIAKQNYQTLGVWLAYYFRGIAYHALGNWHNTQEDLLNAYRINSKDALLKNYLGYLWVDNGINIDRGITLIKQALDQQPNNPNFLDSYAWGLFKKGDPSTALTISKKALQLDPNNSILLDHAGSIYYVLGDKPKAEICWSKAFNLTKTNSALKIAIKDKLEGRMPIYLKYNSSLYDEDKDASKS